MAITTSIFATWRQPARVFRRQLDNGPREPHALAVLLGACFLLFVAQWPRLAREAYAYSQSNLSPAEKPGLDALMGSTLFALMFLAPLLFYAMAAISTLVMRAIGRPISGYAARLALFWALLCSAPLMLFHGLLAGIKGPGLAVGIVGGIIFLAFLWLWTRLLREAAR